MRATLKVGNRLVLWENINVQLAFKEENRGAPIRNLMPMLGIFQQWADSVASWRRHSRAISTDPSVPGCAAGFVNRCRVCRARRAAKWMFPFLCRRAMAHQRQLPAGFRCACARLPVCRSRATDVASWTHPTRQLPAGFWCACARLPVCRSRATDVASWTHPTRQLPADSGVPALAFRFVGAAPRMWRAGHTLQDNCRPDSGVPALAFRSVGAVPRMWRAGHTLQVLLVMRHSVFNCSGTAPQTTRPPRPSCRRATGSRWRGRPDRGTR